MADIGKEDSAEGCPASQGLPRSYSIVCGEVTETQALLVFWTHSQLNLWTENLQLWKADCDMSCG